jgi:ribosomal protein S18 acetylase RimI-like enzyme
MSIENLDPSCEADVDSVAMLHETYLADSPIAKMGKRFIREFYYSKLVECGLIGCSFCRVDGRAVGFISYTAQPMDFMSRGLRRYFFSLSWIMLRSVATRPAMLKEILATLRIMGSRASESKAGDPRGLGEALSLAVVPDFQGYSPPGGKSRLAFRLFETAVERLRAQGVDRIYVSVQADNLAANLLYSTMGCSFEKTGHLSAVIHRYTYQVPRLPETGRSEASG